MPAFDRFWSTCLSHALARIHVRACAAAIDSEDLGAVIAFIQDGKIDVNKETFSGETALTLAAALGDVAMIKFLVGGVGAGPAVTFCARVALDYRAAADTGVATVPNGVPPMQVNSGADPNLQTARGASPLSEAINCGKSAAATTLIQCGADPLELTSLKETLLHQVLAVVPVGAPEEVPNEHQLHTRTICSMCVNLVAL